MLKLIQLSHVDGTEIVVSSRVVDRSLARFAQHLNTSLRELKTRLDSGERVRGSFRTIWYGELTPKEGEE